MKIMYLILTMLVSSQCFSDVYTPYNLKSFSDDQITTDNAWKLVKVFEIGIGSVGNFQSSPMFFDDSLIITYPGIGIGVNNLSTGRQRCIFRPLLGTL